MSHTPARRYLWLPLSAALALAGLGCAPPAPDPEPARASPLPDTGGVGPLDALSRRFGRLRRRMVERGYDEELGLARLLVLEGEGQALPADLATGVCTTFVALAGGSVRTLAMRLHDADGDEIAVDTVEGEGALVHACPQTDEPVATLPHYLVIEAPEGSGAVVAGAFASPVGRGSGFDGVFDGILAPHVPFRAVEERLAASRGLLRARGLLPVGEPLIESLAEGEALRLRVSMDAGRCYVGVGRSGEGVIDIDMVLTDEAGAEVARDLERDAEPTLEHCPEEPGRYTVEVRAYEGAGAVGVMLLAGPGPERGPQAAAAEATAAEAREEGAGAGDTDPVTALTAVAATLEARGYAEPVFVVRDGYIGPGEVRTREVLLPAGCTVVLGAAGRSAMDLDLYLTGEDGRLVDQDTGIQPMARVRACLAQPTVMHLTAKSYGRRGPYALALLRAPDDIRDVRDLRLEEATAAFAARGFTRVSRFEVSLEQGERLERPVIVRGGTCAAIAAAGDVGVEDLDLFLRDQEGTLLASASGPEPYASVSRCAEAASEPLVLEILLYRGGGTIQLSRLEAAP